MSELDDRLDDRVRAALSDLGDAADQQIRSPGVPAVVEAGRRRRRAARVTGTALALVLAGGLTSGWWLMRDTTPSNRTDQIAAPRCLPAEGSAYLPTETTDDLRVQVGAMLARSPEVDSSVYRSKEEAWQLFKQQFRDAPDLVAATKPDSLPESWKFTLRCASDCPAVQERLQTVNGVHAFCNALVPNKSTVHGNPTPTR